MTHGRHLSAPIALLAALTLGACGDGGITHPDGVGTRSVVSARQADVPMAAVDTVFEIGGLGGDFAMATDVNDAGVAVGWGETATREDRAFVWSEDEDLAVLTPSAVEARAGAINDAGQVAGWREPPQGLTEAYRWSRATGIQPLANPDSRTGAQARGIGPDGTVVGNVHFESTQAAVWRTPGSVEPVPTPPASFSSAEDVNGGGTVVGSILDGGFGAFLTPDGGDPVALPGLGGGFSIAEAVDENGIAVGVSMDASFAFRPVFWDESRDVHALPLPEGATEGEAHGINGDGWIVGFSDRRPLLWKPSGDGYRAFALDDEGFATGISDEGHVSGSRNGQAVVWVVSRGGDLSVACEPSPVVRGNDVTCEADAGGTAPDEVSWTFTGGGHTVTESTTARWEGTMVVSGTVEAAAEVGGAELSASTEVTVRARDWEDPVPEVPDPTFCAGLSEDCPLQDPPRSKDDFGKTQLFPTDLAAVVERRVLFARADGGPNDGLRFLVSDPVPPIPFERYQIYVHQILTQPRNPFWRRNGDCTPAEVEQYREIVLEHERQHTRSFIANLELNPVNQILEDVHAGSRNRLQVALERALEEAKELIDRNSDPGPLPTAPCTVEFGGT